MDEAFRPKRPPLEKRALGALQFRKGNMDANSMQNMSGGKRYNLSVTQQLAEEDMKKAMKKVSQKKLKVAGTMTGKPADPITLEPDKNINGQGMQN